MRRWIRAAGTALMFVAAHGPLSAPLHAQPASALPEIQIHLVPSHEAYRSRVRTVAQAVLAEYSEWLGPAPMRSVTIVERPWRGEVPEALAQVIVDVPWWSAPASMELESQVAYGIASQWWPSLLVNPETRSVVHGIAWYLQSRVVESLFDLEFLLTAHSADGARLFGGAVPWTFRSLPLGRWTAGLGRAEFLGLGASAGAWPLTARRRPRAFDPTTPRGALAFGTLERYLGWPALQGALRALASRASSDPMTRLEIQQTLGAAAGQDLSWFFEAVFDGSRRFDYAVQSLSTEPAPASCGFTPCYLTRATVVRRGAAVFAGTSRTGSGPYESGDAMEFRVEFADGQRVSTRWDGRGASRIFEFESAAPATAARLDPDRVLLLDDNYLDNTRLTRADPNVPIGKWVARWMVWLQDAMLSYTF